MAVLTMLDRFPWFALLQWLVRPSRLEGGIRFQPLAVGPAIAPSATWNGNTTYFELRSQEASIVPFFAWFHRLLTLLVGQYSALHLARCLLLGHIITSVSDCRAQLDS